MWYRHWFQLYGIVILVTGRLQIRKWEDRDGSKRSAVEIQADNLYFAGGERKRQPERETAPINNGSVGGFDEIWNPDEVALPF